MYNLLDKHRSGLTFIPLLTLPVLLGEYVKITNKVVNFTTVLQGIIYLYTYIMIK